MRESTYRSPRHLPTNCIVTHSSELGLFVAHHRVTHDREIARLLAPVEVINTMIDLWTQMALLEQQIQALQPAFFAACDATGDG